MKLRKDSAFGIHFDFHALPGDAVADIYKPELIGALLDRVKPDYVQFDTKGHAGLSSYPTRIGKQADAILHDMLLHWREETKKREIALYGHHSGIYDMYAAKMHPEWAVVDEHGNVSTEYLSVFSPYTDEILIPQLKELAGEYALNGAWVDGDCWALRMDYSAWAQKAYFEKTGNRKLPKLGENGFADFVKFNQDGFKEYVSHYIREVKKKFPHFQITSNWIFSEFMPEKVSVPVDFLSGDYDSFDSVNSARHQGRLLAAQDTAWDLMSWGQNTKLVDWREVNRQNKEPVQLMQEAAVTLALGGGFEFFDIVYGHGGLIQSWCIEGWGEVADFVRAREICLKSKLVDEIGVLYTCAKNMESDLVYLRNEAPCNLLLCLQDAQLSTQFLLEEQTERFFDFKLLVLPEADALPENTVEALKAYVQNGGRVIVDLPSIHYFNDVYAPGMELEKRLIYVDGDGRLAAMEADVVYCKDASAAQMYLNNYYEAEHYAAYKKVNYGEGVFVFHLFDLGKSCRQNRSKPYRSYLKNLIDATGFEPKVRISSSLVDVTVAQKDAKMLVNLMNMCGAHNEAGVRSFDEIPPLMDLQVEIDYPKVPNCIKRLPENDDLTYSYDGKTIRFTIDKLPIHSIITIE